MDILLLTLITIINSFHCKVFSQRCWVEVFIHHLSVAGSWSRAMTPQFSERCGAEETTTTWDLPPCGNASWHLTPQVSSLRCCEIKSKQITLYCSTLQLLFTVWHLCVDAKPRVSCRIWWQRSALCVAQCLAAQCAMQDQRLETIKKISLSNVCLIIAAWRNF